MKTCLLRTLSKFVASRKLTILGFGRTDALKERREKGRKGKRAKGERGAVVEKKLSLEERRREKKRAQTREKKRDLIRREKRRTWQMLPAKETPLVQAGGSWEEE